MSDVPEYSQIRSERRDAVAIITLDRPERMNAWTPIMGGELADAIGRANNDRAIGAIVLTGEGRGFCAGADMEDTFQSRIDGADSDADGAGDENGLPEGLDWVKLVRESKPMVAAVNGAAVGVGLTQILPFDVIVASEAARFGMFFVKVGLVPELASTHFLVQRMGFGRASEMCLSGRLYDAEEALQAGLIERMVAPEALLDTALEIAGTFAANPPPQLLMTKSLLTLNGSATDLAAVQEAESRLLQQCFETPEHKEAVAAFIEKRPAKYR